MNSRSVQPGSANYNFTRNDPFDHEAAVELVIPRLMSSGEYMRTIRTFPVPRDSFAVWYLGQNGFLLKDATGLLVGIDLYLTNSCARAADGLPYRMDRQLPIFIEPEDLDVDVFVTTHSHQDHADPETLQRMPKRDNTLYVGPFDSYQLYETCGVPRSASRLLHPGETVSVGTTKLMATFALPTDDTDLNHSGLLVTFENGSTFFNTGDTGWSERLAALLPRNVDVCAICINGGYHNLSAEQAAQIVTIVSPRVVIPCHYDMMINNVGSPAMFRVALERAGSTASFRMLRYYEAWLYSRTDQASVVEVTSPQEFR